MSGPEPAAVPVSLPTLAPAGERLGFTDLVRDRTRNYYHGTTGKAADEPVILAAIGVASAKAFAATSTIAAAAALLERSWDAPADFGRSLEATLAASQAKITVETLALEVIDALTQVASGSTLSTGRALDRHWRNVKVLASHNPSIYKQRVLGGTRCTGRSRRSASTSSGTCSHGRAAGPRGSRVVRPPPGASSRQTGQTRRSSPLRQTRATHPA